MAIEPPRADMKGFQLSGVAISIDRTPYASTTVISVVVRARDVTGSLPMVEVLTRGELHPDEGIGEQVRAVVLRALAHEVDEWLRVNGERVREPHPAPEQALTVAPEFRRRTRKAGKP